MMEFMGFRLKYSRLSTVYWNSNRVDINKKQVY